MLLLSIMRMVFSSDDIESVRSQLIGEDYVGIELSLETSIPRWLIQSNRSVQLNIFGFNIVKGIISLTLISYIPCK